MLLWYFQNAKRHLEMVHWGCPGMKQKRDVSFKLTPRQKHHCIVDNSHNLGLTKHFKAPNRQ